MAVKMIRKIYVAFSLALAFIFYFNCRKNASLFSPLILLKRGVVQRIFGVNRATAWPVHHSSVIHASSKINPGTRCPGLSPYCYLDGRNGIVFKKNVWVGPRVSIISRNHDLCDYSQYTSAKPIVIEDNCWIGANAIILPSVELGAHTIVAAGSVVTKSFPDGNILIAGNPARIIKEIGEYEGNKPVGG